MLTRLPSVLLSVSVTMFPAAMTMRSNPSFERTAMWVKIQARSQSLKSRSHERLLEKRRRIMLGKYCEKIDLVIQIKNQIDPRPNSKYNCTKLIQL